MSAYCTLQELINRFGQNAIVERADRDGDGQPDPPVIDQALATATSIIDAHVGARYALPLATLPASLMNAACTIAYYTLFQEVIPEAVQRLYNDAIRYLEGIAAGKIALTLQETTVQPNRLEVAYHHPRQAFSDRIMRHF
ncbi:MAG: DUF1320 domain-containing protein [Magnetococcales bacterium]|nr:DUF1320 domain-containing protein [Magnetococcales bacterium]